MPGVGRLSEAVAVKGNGVQGVDLFFGLAVGLAVGEEFEFGNAPDLTFRGFAGVRR